LEIVDVVTSVNESSVSAFDFLASEYSCQGCVSLGNTEGVVCIVVDLVRFPIFSCLSRDSVHAVLADVVSTFVISIISSHGPESLIGGSRGELDNAFSRVFSNSLFDVSRRVVKRSESHFECNLFSGFDVSLKRVDELNPLTTSIFINDSLHIDFPFPRTLDSNRASMSGNKEGSSHKSIVLGNGSSTGSFKRSGVRLDCNEGSDCKCFHFIIILNKVN
jgi:hypothetical protein